ncbi:NAD(P)H-dependent oxidoreductase [Lacticaseibacillus parakribbianus]|uniref:NAD(P)H-dependent oxidoreductase n=1 Tax=Lacticaseibacillus parakribbianus TaxID=2970927 RepID=UPI0021CB2BA0|nr:NAD(P)H-dependent oxidoreductase [Lacticaseibacillus parakribbianus]
MAKTIIVTCHPYAGSFCHALMLAVQQGASAAGQEVDVIDLEADHFDPVMHSADLIGFLKHQAQDAQAQDYIRRLQTADHLVLIFPIWWELMPAMMKGFIDKVVFPGETFDYTPSGTGMRSRLTRLKSTTIITTMNTPQSLYRWVFGNAIQRALVRGTFQKMGLRHVSWCSCNMVKKSKAAKRQAWLRQAERIGARS